MASSPEKNAISPYEKPLKWFTGRNIIFNFMPMQGVLSYTALSVNIMCPSLMLRGLHRDVILNSLLIETLLGTGLYFYSRDHLRTASIEKRILFSTFGAISFTMASISLWNTLRDIVPQDLALCTACGVGSSWGLITAGRLYCNYIDSELDY